MSRLIDRADPQAMRLAGAPASTIESVVLGRFLKDVTYRGGTLASEEKLFFGSLDDVRTFLESRLGMLTLEAREPGAAKKNVAICLAENPEREDFLLIKFKPRLIGADRMQALSLTEGTVRDLREEEWTTLQRIYVVLELGPRLESFSALELTKFVYRPIAHLVRQTTAVQLVSAALSFAFFITNLMIISYVVPQLSLDALRQITWVVAAVSLCSFLLSFVSSRIDLFMGNIIEERLELVRLSLLLNLHPSHFDAQSITRVLQSAEIVSNVCRTVFSIFTGTVAFIAQIPFLVILFLRLPTTLFFIVVGVSLVSALIAVVFRVYVRRKTTELDMENADLTNFVLDIIAHIDRLAFYDSLTHFYRRWRKAALDVMERRWHLDKAALWAEQTQATLQRVIQIISILGVTLVLQYTLESEVGGELTIATAFIIFHLVTSVYQIIPRLTGLVASYFEMRVDLELTKELRDNVYRAEARLGPVVTSGVPEVRADKVVLPYGCRVAGRKEADFCFADGMLVQVAGASGSGKSTLLRCVMGLIQPLSGEMQVFGADPYLFSLDERGRIFSYVSQHVQLVPGTLKENLGLFSDDRNARIWECLELVRLARKVESLPLGLNTPISGVGSSFSTGEMQRIILAQTLLKPAEILVLDEATSGLPADYEKDIFEVIRQRFKIAFVVSHREHIARLVDHRLEMTVAGE